MVEEYFYGRIKKTSNGHRITVPKMLMMASKIQANDLIKVTLKKEDKEDISTIKEMAPKDTDSGK